MPKGTLYFLRKSYMTLLETLIALLLLALLLAFIFGCLRELSAMADLSERTQKESFQMRYLESRLGFIFERIVNEHAVDRTFYFYTQPPQEEISLFPSLVFTFNNEIRCDPAFSGDVLARLYLDRQHRLCLAIWPLHLPEPQRYLHEEVLCDRVSGFKCFFYAAPEKALQELRGADQKPVPKGNTWHEGEWAWSYGQMPAIIKITIELSVEEQGHTAPEQRELTFSFALPSSKHPVYYPPL